MAKIYEHPILLVEDIDLFSNVYGNLSISSTSPFKSVVFSYLHANVIDTMGTTTITLNIKGGLIKTHAKFLKKGLFLFFMIGKFFCEGQNRLWQRRFRLDNWTFHSHKSDNHSNIWFSCEVAFFVKRHNSWLFSPHAPTFCYNHHCFCCYWNAW